MSIRNSIVRASSVAVTILGLAVAARPARAQGYDIILRHGTVLDGSGRARYRADVGIANGRIARIGDLARDTAAIDLDLRGLLVAPGFINLHSHAMPLGVRTAENMLTQGVTTEIINADGGGPIDIGPQLAQLAADGLAENVGAYVGFNSVWASVMGPTDHRPTADETARMQALVTDNLKRGAWGVSAGLDYKPGYFATAAEAAAVVEPARPWRTNFPNHDRLSPENGYSSRAGMLETSRIGFDAGLVPEFTHMKLQGHEQGTAGAFLAWMSKEAAAGHYQAADVYPYLAGQTALSAFFVPGWAQDGGREKMLERFRDPALRAKIVAEAEVALKARFGGPEGVFFPATKRELVDIMKEMQLTSPGETIVRLLETDNPTVILRFGAEADLQKLLRYPSIAIACDCGAMPPGRGTGHPRNAGTFPRVLGHYVRETHTLTWEAAIRKMSGLPASTIGLADRGYLAPGMAADVTVFDSSTVIDHATYEDPNLPSDGIRVVIVNGKVALRDGKPTGEQGGLALVRTGHLPSRPTSERVARRVSGAGVLRLATAEGAPAPIWSDSTVKVAVELSQGPADRWPKGTLRIRSGAGGTLLDLVRPGLIQAADKWAAITGRAKVGPGGEERSVTVIVEEADPFAAGNGPTLTIEVDGRLAATGPLAGRVRVTSRR